MKTLLRALLLLTLVTSPALAETPAPPKDPSAAAMAFTAQFSDTHLMGMLKRIGSRQKSLVALSQLHGQMLAAVFDAEVEKAVQKHGPTWHRNMARAWTGLLSDAEFESLSIAGAASPHTDKYGKMTPQAGQRMQTLSGDLLRTIMLEVIQNTLKTLAETTSGDGKSSKTKAPDPKAAKPKTDEKTEPKSD